MFNSFLSDEGEIIPSEIAQRFFLLNVTENGLSNIEKRLNQKIEQKELFTIKWKM
jgi:hypothetical protein